MFLVVTCSVRSMKLEPELGLEDCCKIKLSCGVTVGMLSPVEPAHAEKA